jgi:predicted RNase H-like HicB family nuclease
MKTYNFKVVIEPDEDRWLAYSPALVDRGAGTWGYTKEEARANIQVVLRMTIESMIRHGETIPEDTTLENEGEEPQIAITI